MGTVHRFGDFSEDEIVFHVYSDHFCVELGREDKEGGLHFFENSGCLHF